MHAIKAKAVVNGDDQLHILDAPLGLESGNIVEVIILYRKPDTPKSNWQSILASIGTYNEEELSGFAEIRKR
jgi:hypothetical protein